MQLTNRLVARDVHEIVMHFLRLTSGQLFVHSQSLFSLLSFILPSNNAALLLADSYSRSKSDFSFSSQLLAMDKKLDQLDWVLSAI